MRAAVVALLVVLVMPASASATREQECRFQYLQHGVWTAHEEAKTTRCVLERWPAPGGMGTFDSIITCESGWNRLAYNPSGPYVGLGQHALSAWSSRVHSYEPAHWELKPAWQNSRTMITVTVRMMRAVGLSPWACA